MTIAKTGHAKKTICIMEEQSFKFLYFKEENKMNEELMTNEAVDTVAETLENVMERRSGKPIGLGIIIGGALACAAIMGAKQVERVWDKHKAKNEQPVMVVSDNENEIVEEEE